MSGGQLRGVPAGAGLRLGWIAAAVAAFAVHAWNVAYGPLLRGYDAHGHIGYFLYLDLYRAIPWADQGWSYFHPPLHYFLGWILMQFGSADVLLRGLSVLASLWSLGIAGLGAHVVSRIYPRHPAFSLLAFVSLAFLPVYLYVSTTVGNELLAAALATAGLAVFLNNETRDRPTLRSDAAVGLLLGCALLTKVSSVIVLGAVAGAIGLRAMRERPLGPALRLAIQRGAVVAGLAVIVASPYYARNVVEFGTPLKMSRDNPFVSAAESSQPPGNRTWTDFVAFPPALFVNVEMLDPALLHSVWGSAYAQMWADLRIAWDGLDWDDRPLLMGSRRVMLALGVAPTLFALFGGLLACLDCLRGRRVRVYIPLLVCVVSTLSAFVYFAIASPHWSALKASYLLGLTLPYAVFLARGLEALLERMGSTGPILAAAIVGVPALAAACVNANGLIVPPLDDEISIGSLRFQFGDLEGAQRDYMSKGGDAFAAKHSWLQWRDNLAAIALVRGDPVTARSLYRSHRPRADTDPFRWNATAVATALAGHPERALDLADAAVAAGAGAVGLLNRGVIRAMLGDLPAAEADLRAALEMDGQLAPAWHNLAEVLEAMGVASERTTMGAQTRSLRTRAALAAQSPARGYPYGIPNGLGQNPSWQLAFRWMLWLDGAELRLARAPFRPSDAVAMRDPASLLADRPDVVMIVVDTLRADHLGAWGYDRPTSPNLDRLASQGYRFSRARSPSSWTLPSVASLFTSTSPAVHRMSVWGENIDPRFVTVAERFEDAGYVGLGVSGNFVHITAEAGFARGFARFESPRVRLEGRGEDPLLELPGPEGTLRLRASTAAEINEIVFDALPPADGPPLFLYVHYMEPHSGYDPPESVRRAFETDPAVHARGPAATSAYVTSLARRADPVEPAERQRLIDLYDAEIATVDAEIGALLAGLEARGFGEELVVVVTSDHGEELGDHGSWFHGLTLFEESIAVPLLIRDTRLPGGVVIDEPVELVDVPTTLLALAGIAPAPEMGGRVLLGGDPPRARNLIASLAADPSFEREVRQRVHLGSLESWPWKLIALRAGRVQAYHLASDPGERRPLGLLHPKVPESIRTAAKVLAKELKSRPRKRKKSQYLPLKMRAQLRALGYAQ